MLSEIWKVAVDHRKGSQMFEQQKPQCRVAELKKNAKLKSTNPKMSQFCVES